MAAASAGDAKSTTSSLRLISEDKTLTYDLIPAVTPRVIIGREAGKCDLVLHDNKKPPLLSRTHCKITYANGQWCIEDLQVTYCCSASLSPVQSTNGVFVNDIKVQKAIVKPGATISFARGSGVAIGAEFKDPQAYIFNVVRGKRAAEEELTPRKKKIARLSVPVDKVKQRTEERRRLIEERRAKQQQREQAMLAEKARVESELASKTAEIEAHRKAAEAERKRLEQQQAQFLQQQAEAEKMRAEMQAEMKRLRATAEAEKKAAEEEAARQVRLAADAEARRMEEKLRTMEETLQSIQSDKESLAEKLADEAKLAEEQRAREAELKKMEGVLKDQEKHLAELRKEKDDGLVIGRELSEQFECSICAELFIKATTLTCSHTFCYECITEWLGQNDICPVCRTKPSTVPVRTIALDQAVQSIVDKMPEAEKQMREEVIKERQASKARAPEPEVVHISSDEEDEDYSYDPFESESESATSGDLGEWYDRY